MLRNWRLVEEFGVGALNDLLSVPAELPPITRCHIRLGAIVSSLD